MNFFEKFKKTPPKEKTPEEVALEARQKIATELADLKLKKKEIIGFRGGGGDKNAADYDSIDSINSRIAELEGKLAGPSGRSGGQERPPAEKAA